MKPHIQKKKFPLRLSAHTHNPAVVNEDFSVALGNAQDPLLLNIYLNNGVYISEVQCFDVGRVELCIKHEYI